MRSAEIRVHFGRGDPELSVELVPDGAAPAVRSAGEALPPPHLAYVEIRGPYDPVARPLPVWYRPRISLRARARSSYACLRPHATWPILLAERIEGPLPMLKSMD